MPTLFRPASVSIAFALAAALALHAGDVVTTLALTSPENGATLAPGTLIEWSVRASVPSEGCAGLALVLVDLVQDQGNPAALDIPPADGVPAGMELFSRPLGVSNPGEDGRDTGYVGVRRGTPGARDLVQIGGGQNTTGRPGEVMGTNVDVRTGVGQDAPALIASGRFPAPDRQGTYRFRLEHPLVNTLDAAAPPPAGSPLRAAAVELAAEAFSFTVADEGPCPAGCFIRGDCNGDGEVSGSVSDAVFLLRFNFLGGTEPPCLAACDANGDGQLLGSVTDAVFLLQFSFLGGPELPPPFPGCGAATEPTDLELGCVTTPDACR